MLFIKKITLNRNIRNTAAYRNQNISSLTSRGLVTPYGYIDLGQHWFRYWLFAWQHRAFTWTYVDIPPKVFCVIHLKAIPQEVLMNIIRTMCLESTLLKSLSHLLGTSELNRLGRRLQIIFWWYGYLHCTDVFCCFQIWSYIYIAILLVSIVTLLLETEPLFRVPRNPTLPTGNDTNRKMLLYMTTRQHPALLWMGIVTTVIFCVELVIRFMVWPKPWRFLLEFYNVVDALSIVPLTVTMVISHTLPGYWTKSRTNLSAIFAITAVTSVGRSVRIFKIVRHNRALRVLALALQASFQELLLLLMLVVIGMVVFSTAIYYAEFYRDGDEFQTIPVGFWWAVITMTTVGYGDVYPTTTAGHAVGCACALAGILITGLPIPVIASNFNRFYGYAKLRDRISNRKRKKIKLRLGEMASSSESDAQSQGNAAPTWQHVSRNAVAPTSM